MRVCVRSRVCKGREATRNFHAERQQGKLGFTLIQFFFSLSTPWQGSFLSLICSNAADTSPAEALLPSKLGLESPLAKENVVTSA